MENNTVSVRANSQKIRDMVFVGMFTAILAVISQISIPLPTNVPLTLQTFAVALAGFYLGEKRGTLSVFVYILVGLAGAPVFANWKGGFEVLSGFTGGFLYGFLGMAFLCGLGAKTKKMYWGIALGLVGLVFANLCGALQYMLISNISFWKSLATVSLPFFLKDCLLVIGAQLISIQLTKRLPVKK